MKLPEFQDSLLYHWRYKLAYSVLLVLSFVTLTFKLGTLTPGLSMYESSHVQTVSLSNIVERPVNAPYRVMQWASLKYIGTTDASVRLPSILFGFLTIFALYVALRRIHSERSALVGSLLLATSSFFLPYARHGTADITLAAGLAITFAVMAWVYVVKRSPLGLVVMAAAAAFALYIPLGIVWLLIGLLMAPLALRNDLLQQIQRRHFILPPLIFAALISPLLYAMTKHPFLVVKDMLLWPSELPTVFQFFKFIGQTLLGLLWLSPSAPEFHLSHLPFLDIFTVIMMFLGILHLISHRKLKRIRFIVASMIVSLLIIGLSQSATTFVLLVPIVYMCAGMGVSRLFREWNAVFPRNPFARAAAIVPMTLVIGFVTIYHLKYTFLAWPKNPETKSVYKYRLED